VKTNRKALLERLRALKPGLAGQGILEQSVHILFRGGRAATYNDEVAVSVEVGLDFEAAIEADPLLKLLAKLPDDEVELALDGGELSVRGARRRAGLRVEAGIALPVDAAGQPEEWRPVPEGLVEAIGVVGSCCSGDASHPILRCVHLAPDRVEACDSFQVCRWPLRTGLAKPVLVRRSSLRAVESAKPAEWALTEGWVHWRAGGLSLACRRVAGEYPDVGPHLEGEGGAVKLPEGLAAAVDRAAVFVERDALELVRVELRAGKLRVSGRGPSGRFSEVLDVGYAGEPLAFDVAPRLLLELVALTDEVTIGTGRLLARSDKWRYVTCTQAPGAE